MTRPDLDAIKARHVAAKPFADKGVEYAWSGTSTSQADIPVLLEYIAALESNPERLIPASRSDEEAAVGLWYMLLDRANTKDDFIKLAADWAQSIRANAVKVQL